MGKKKRKRRVRKGRDAAVPSTPGEAGPPARIHLALVLSGAASLIHEVCWNRGWSRVLGAGMGTTAIVLTVFMAGLGAGAYGYRRVGRWLGGRGRALYRRLEVALAVLGLVVAFGIPWFEAPVGAAAAALGPLSPALGVVRFLVALVVLGPVAVLMGATFPAITEELASGEGAERRLGWLYAANTAGAVLGVVGAAYVLIPTLGLRASAGVAGLASLTAALLAGGKPHLPEEGGEAAEPARVSVYAVYAFVGFWGLAFEVFFARAILSAAGASPLAFAAMLGSFLLGIALGGALGGALLGDRADPVRSLAHRLALVGVAALVSSAALARFHEIFAAVFLGPSGAWHPMAATWALAAALLLPVGLALGSIFPVATRCLAGPGGVGVGVGRAYLVNSLAGAAGSMAAHYVIAPLAGVRGGVLAGAAAMFAAAAWVGGRAGGRLAPALYALLALGVLVGQPGERMRIVAATYQHLTRSDPERLEESLEKGEDYVLWYRDGPEVSVAILGYGEEKRLLVIDGKVDAGTAGDMLNQTMVGLIGPLFRPEAREALIIGLGSGASTDSLLLHPIERVDTAEISATVLDGARFGFEHLFPRAYRDPRSHIHVTDGRYMVQNWPRPVDLIVSQPTNLHVQGVGDLYTREFLEACRARLRDGGVLVQWLQDYDLPKEAVTGIARTVMEVFPHVHLMHFRDPMLVASERPLELDGQAVARLLADPEAQALLRRFRLQGVDLVAGHMLADGPALRRAVGDGPVYRDDLPRLEYQAARGLFQKGDALKAWLNGFLGRPPGREELPTRNLLVPAEGGGVFFQAAGLRVEAGVPVEARIDRSQPAPGWTHPDTKDRVHPTVPVLDLELPGGTVDVNACPPGVMRSSREIHGVFEQVARRKGGTLGPVLPGKYREHVLMLREYPGLGSPGDLAIGSWVCGPNHRVYVVTARPGPGGSAQDLLGEALGKLDCLHPGEG